MSIFLFNNINILDIIGLSLYFDCIIRNGGHEKTVRVWRTIIPFKSSHPNKLQQ